MKANPFTDEISNNIKISNWLRDNIVYKPKANLTAPDGFIVIDGVLYTNSGISILSNVKELPYEFRNGSTFCIEDPLLETCKNFPTSATTKEMHFKFKKCHNLDFSLFPAREGLSLEIDDINDISFKKIYANKELRTENCFVDNSKSKYIHDCSLWDGINTNNLYIELCSELKNLTQTMLIPKDKLDYLQFNFYENATQHYDDRSTLILTNAVSRFRSLKKNPIEFMMDMTLFLIDKGFESVV